MKTLKLFFLIFLQLILNPSTFAIIILIRAIFPDDILTEKDKQDL